MPSLIGPDATPGENAIALVGCLVGAALATAEAREKHRGLVRTLVLSALAFDLVRGVAANATHAAARVWHRSEVPPLKQFMFAAAHIHPFVATCTTDAPTKWAAHTYGTMTVATIATLLAPQGAPSAC